MVSLVWHLSPVRYTTWWKTCRGGNAFHINDNIYSNTVEYDVAGPDLNITRTFYVAQPSQATSFVLTALLSRVDERYGGQRAAPVSVSHVDGITAISFVSVNSTM